MASNSKSSDDKKKSKKSNRSGAESSSRRKDKEKKSKGKDRQSSSKKDKTVAPTEPPSTAPAVTTPPIVHDPDAIQLFRRYDRNRSGVLTRLDFLQLLRDYADPTTSGWGAAMSRPPLSLTDTSGIPLGYQRADRNSEFEAGQLFERYDRDHTGALTLDTFHVFFADFKPQLRAFVEESNYRPLVPLSISEAPVPLQPVKEEESVLAQMAMKARDVGVGNDDLLNPTTVRAQYRAALWKLRKMCKDELFDQRDRIVQQLKLARDEMANRQRNSRRSDSVSRWGDTRRGKRRPRATPFSDFEEDGDYFAGESNAVANRDEAKRYESMENDLDQLDELIRLVRRYLNKGNDVTLSEMQEFIEQADKVEEEAQCLAMKNYGEIEQHSISKQEKGNDPPPASTSVSTPIQPSPQQRKQTDLEGLLRVKDQMIYQLLQERTAMRKERNAVETSLKKLSEVSTREMKKWARLTDDMQTEIEHLRSQLSLQFQQRNTLV